MAYLVVENFSAGLDTRRHPLTAKSGTLQTLKNAHITRGGEIEKRKKFATFATLAANTFGMEATSDTIYVFGSVVAPTMPTGVTYQRLQHPDGAAMTEVVFSTLYGGYPFVIAKYADGKSYPFWNGTIIGDFVDGVTRASMANASSGSLALAGVAYHMAGVINASGTGYTATAVANYVEIYGPPEIAWTASAVVDSPITATTSVIQTPAAATPEQLASGGFTINGGSASVKATAITTLRYIGTTPGITGIYVGGREILKLAAGASITYTSQPSGATYYDSGQRLAYAISYYINQAASVNTGFTATYGYKGGGWSGNDPADLTINSPATDPGSYNGQEVWIEFDANPSSAGSIAELVSTATITTSPHNAGRYYAKLAGTGILAGGSTNAVTSVKVDGVEVLGAAVQWTSSNTTTMQSVVNQINAYASVPDYNALLSGSLVLIKGLPGTGSSINGRQITVTVTGNVTAGGLVEINGGINAVAALPQWNRIYLNGAFATGKKVQFIATPALDPANAIYWGATRVNNVTPVTAITFKTKAHITSGSSLFFSGVNQPTKWGDNATGSGFINLSNNSGGNEVLTALALYQGNLAAFARRSVQLWGIDTDPANNRQGQVLSNTGTFAPNSVVSVGEIDVFYLSDSGVRSLRARDASNAAVVNDVGTPIDNLILTDISTFTEAQKAACCAIIEPIDGRYWLAIGSKIYVYSYFPNSQVAAWSIYEPGFTVSKFTAKDGRVYARSGNVIYLYGGTNNDEYDASTVEVIMPFLDASKPAHQKTLLGVDMTCEGSWQLYIGMDPLAPNARDDLGIISQPTFSLGRVMAAGTGTHFGVRFVNNTSGYARLANFIAHFELNEAD